MRTQRHKNDTMWVGSWGEIAWGEMPDIGNGEEGSTSYCHVCTYATILYVLHMYPKTLNAIKKKRKHRMLRNDIQCQESIQERNDHILVWAITMQTYRLYFSLYKTLSN